MKKRGSYYEQEILWYTRDLVEVVNNEIDIYAQEISENYELRSLERIKQDLLRDLLDYIKYRIS